MELLVLGGTGFVGRAVVEEGLARGWSVTTFNRGRGATPAGVARVIGDRLRPEDLAPLAASDYDLVVDTWSGEPRAVRDSAALLGERAARYAYVSSGSVYAPPLAAGADEEAPTVDPGGSDYAAHKRGAELAATAAFGERALLARCGLILGPWEDVGRLPWWLERLARGGAVLAPGPPDLGLQLIDVRDLAAWLLGTDASGPVNAVSRPGHTTTQAVLEACRAVTGGAAELHWRDPDAIAAAGIDAWSELPLWIPPGHPYRGLLEMDAGRAHTAGLRCRPVQDTVAATWAWLESVGHRPPLRPDLPPPGLDPAKERAALRR